MAEPTLVDDREHVGHAILRLVEARGAPLAVALRFADATFLGADGRRGRGRHLFAAGAVDPLPTRDFRLGPDVTAHVREAEVVTLIEPDGTVLGPFVWTDIRVPPLAGAGARLGAGGGRKPARQGAAAPMFAARAASLVPAAKVAPPAAAVGPAPPAVAPRDHRRRVLALLVVPLFALLLASAAVLAGCVGWHLEPAEVAFTGPPGGGFAPDERKVRLVLAWYARPFVTNAPVPAGAAPDWMALRQERVTDGWALVIAPAEPARALASGAHDARLPLAFPLRTVTDALAVSLRIVRPEPAAPAPIVPPAAVATAPVKAPLPTIDDATCDRFAGNRFDGDHPATAGFTDEIFTLSQADLQAGLAACDANTARGGADRRFMVQRGRLLAHLALIRLAAGDVAEAAAAMNAAVALWHQGDAMGSAYAANLLGAFHSGTFNRPSHAFVTPDDSAADALWKKAMEAGNVVAERNYAAQLLVGKGVARDPIRAVALLRDAASKGDLHASGVLGVALYTGTPSGIALDKAAGWPLAVAAQCVDPSARALVERVIAGGAQPATARRDCR